MSLPQTTLASNDERLESGSERAAKAGGLGLRRQRAGGQVGGRLGEVEGARRHVVRAVGVEDRREQLDLAAPDAVLAHPTAVHPDALCLAVRVELEQCPQAADAGRLDV